MGTIEEQKEELEASIEQRKDDSVNRSVNESEDVKEPPAALGKQSDKYEKFE